MSEMTPVWDRSSSGCRGLKKLAFRTGPATPFGADLLIYLFIFRESERSRAGRGGGTGRERIPNGLSAEGRA